MSVHRNGVDLELVREIARRFREDPPAGRTPFRAGVRWIGGFRTEAELGTHGPLAGDEPRTLGGSDIGPAPEELLLAAVGQCLVVGWASATSAAGIALESLHIEVRGAVDLSAAYGATEGHTGFDRIEVRVHIEADAPLERLEALAAGVLARAPIPSTVSRGVPVEASLV